MNTEFRRHRSILTGTCVLVALFGAIDISGTQSTSTMAAKRWANLRSELRREVHLTVGDLPPFPHDPDSFLVRAPDDALVQRSYPRAKQMWQYDPQGRVMMYQSRGRRAPWSCERRRRDHVEEYFDGNGDLIGFQVGNRVYYWLGSVRSAEEFLRLKFEWYPWPRRDATELPSKDTRANWSRVLSEARSRLYAHVESLPPLPERPIPNVNRLPRTRVFEGQACSLSITSIAPSHGGSMLRARYRPTSKGSKLDTVGPSYVWRADRTIAEVSHSTPEEVLRWSYDLRGQVAQFQDSSGTQWYDAEGWLLACDLSLAGQPRLARRRCYWLGSQVPPDSVYNRLVRYWKMSGQFRGDDRVRS